MIPANQQIENPEQMDANHWRCLNDSMWSGVPAVQVMAYRLLKQLAGEGWPQELLDMLYLDEETKAWAEAIEMPSSTDQEDTRKDANGNLLHAGDSVTLIKDLDVKGAGFTAKRGTLVKNITIGTVADHIEGKVNGVSIYLKTAFLKKA
ncbi:MAG: alkylphosphonate utilization protein [Francisellaceae bacterium]